MKPNVFVSSTFYDLKHVRDDLRRFLDDIGYQALLSERPDFPVDPSDATLDNCRKQVEREADIFVLIVGTRYGSVDKMTLKSVTNLEYLAARAKHIPIYAFIDRALDPLLAVWRRDPAANLSPAIDTPELLRFVDKVQSIEGDGVWTFRFETAAEIHECIASAISDGAGT